MLGVNISFIGRQIFSRGLFCRGLHSLSRGLCLRQMWCVSLCRCRGRLSWLGCVVCGCGSGVDVGVRGRGSRVRVSQPRHGVSNCQPVYVRHVTVCDRAPRAHVECQHVECRVSSVTRETSCVHTESSGVDTGSHRQFCLARKAHVQFSLAPERFTKRNERILPIFFEFGRSVSRTTCSRFPQSVPST